jgi:hypothetical protein
MKLLFATFLILTISPIYAASPQIVESSSDNLLEEIRRDIDAGFLTNDDLGHYIPGYGLELVLEKSNSVPDLDDAVRRISDTMLDYNDTISGLAEDDWVSIYFSAFDDYNLLIRMKQNKPETLEVWTNGYLQD